jgi:ABC-2 type transport system ATP-binding protein
MAVDAAGPFGRPRGRISGVSAALDAGVHAVLGTPEDGTLALADVLSGRAPARSGRVLVAGEDPGRHASIRRRIGVLGATPDLPGGGSVAVAVGMALRARRAPEDPGALLSPLGLARLLGRRLASLAFAEVRAVELALALATPAPLLAVLVEPLADAAIPDAALVEQRIRDLAREGACVVVLTTSPRDARALGDSVHLLDRGALLHQTAPSVELELVVLIREPDRDPPAEGGASGVRALVAAVAGSPAVRGVAWEDAGPRALSTLRVRAADLEAASMVILDAAAASDVVIAAISSPAPALRQVRAAAAGGGAP